MKVLHLISCGDKGGAKTHVFTLLLALQEEIDVTVICFMEGVFYEEIKDMPIRSILLKQKYRNDLGVIKSLIKQIRQNRYHVIHAHGARANFIAMFLRPFIKIPIVTTVHSDYKLDFTDNFYKKHVYTWLNSFSLKFMDYYIGVSDNFKKMLVARGFEAEQIYTVYNTIDFERVVTHDAKADFLKKYAIDLEEDETLVGIIGRFDQVKGHSVFIQACKEVLSQYPKVKFVLAGEGPEEHMLRQLVKKLGLDKHVFFTGFVEDIFSFIHAIDINVLSSHSESFPYVLLEGALMKKATVSTDVGGVSDLIKPEETGLLAKVNNPKDLAEQLVRLLEAPQWRTQLGENLYRFAKANFSKESMKRSHIELYNDMLRREKSQNKNFDIVLSGYYGFDNSGDDALLKAVIDSVRKEDPEVKFLVLSKKPQQTSQEHGVHSINRHDFFAIWRNLKRSRVFIYGGGSLIQDITSTKSLMYYTYLLKFAKLFGLKLMVYGNGIGPITQTANQMRAKKALGLCDYISLREPMSLLELKELGVSVENTVLSVDPALSIVPQMDVTAILKEEGIQPDQRYFAVSCRNWKYNEPQFVKKISGVIDAAHKKYGIIPLYVPMHLNDCVIIKEIMAESQVGGLMLGKIYEVETLMGIIAKTQFVMSMRLHTLVYAVSVGVPIIGLTYDPKVRFFVEYAGQNSHVDTSDLSVADLSHMIDHIMTHHAVVSDAIKQRADELKQLSSQDAQKAIELLK